MIQPSDEITIVPSTQWIYLNTITTIAITDITEATINTLKSAEIFPPSARRSTTMIEWTKVTGRIMYNTMNVKALRLYSTLFVSAISIKL
jgi:hypothetical protein